MSDTTSAEALVSFISMPTPASAFEVIKSCKSYIVNIASSWRSPNLTREDKIRELMTEMLLILLEDFDASRLNHPNSVLLYTHKKLKRLTHQSNKLQPIFIDPHDLEETGRYNFSPSRLELSEEIYQTIRRCLLCNIDNEMSLNTFLFIHVYPEIAWTSRLIAQYKNIDPGTRLEADKKRHARFNAMLKAEFALLQNGDWHEISTWSGGERSHLAWRIINISPAEVTGEAEKLLTSLEQWRETIDRRQPQTLNDLENAINLLASMKQVYRNRKNLMIAAEEAAPYGEEADLLLQIIGSPIEAPCACESDKEYDISASEQATAGEDALFDKIAEEVTQWLAELVSEKQKSTKKAPCSSGIKYA